MRRILYYTIICFFSVTSLNAQTTNKVPLDTVIADVLAKLPTRDYKRSTLQFDYLMTTGEEGMLKLIERLDSPKDIDERAILEYAISGWVDFAANNNEKKSITTRALEKSLSSSLHTETKSFVLRKLGRIATNENIGAVSKMLLDEQLSDPAAQALLNIGSNQAYISLFEALRKSKSEPVTLNLVNAISQTDFSPAESTLLAMFKQNPTDEKRRVLLNAVANIGSEVSVKTLREEAKKGGYAYYKDNSVASYLVLLNRLRTIKPEVVKKEATSLYAVGLNANRFDLKLAAASILLTYPNTDKLVFLADAIKTENLAYISGLLNTYPFQEDKKCINLITNAVSTSKSPEVQTALIYWCGNNNIQNSVNIISPYINSSNEAIQKAAILSLAKLGGNDALKALINVLKLRDRRTIMLGKNALATLSKDISSPLSLAYNECNEIGKTIVLELIGEKKMSSLYGLVFSQMSVDNENIKEAAAKTLVNIATDKNLEDLFGLMEKEEDMYLQTIQQSISSALNYKSPEEQILLVTERMNKSPKKHLYFTLLTCIQTDKALSLLSELYNTEIGINKTAALEALIDWDSLDAFYPLIEIASTTGNSQEKEKVISSLIEKISKSEVNEVVKYLYLKDLLQITTNNDSRIEIIKLLGETGHYQALLEISTFMNQPNLKERAALAAANIAVSNPSFAGNETTRILNIASSILENSKVESLPEIGKYLAQNPTSGGFTPVFNGLDLTGWKGCIENPAETKKMSRSKLRRTERKANKDVKCNWIVTNSKLVSTGKEGVICTEKEYGDFEMLIDWKLLEGSDSDKSTGISLRGIPMIKISHNQYGESGSGALSGNIVNSNKPLTIADRKIGEWNTFRILVIADRVSVWLNGELVTDDAILENVWNRDHPAATRGPITIHANGSKIVFRDIFIKELKQPTPFQLSDQEAKEGFRVLFDGTNLHQWTGNTVDYTIRDGNLVVEPKGISNVGTRNLYTKEQFDNFIIRFEFQLTRRANNGLGIRTPMEGDAAYVGMELQILDNHALIPERLYNYQYHGSVYGVIPAKKNYLNPTGEWNYQEVIADGDNIKVILNGTTILDGNIREASNNGKETIDGRDHPGLLNETGHIGFLGHGSRLKFRNIRIKEL